ncbi:MAG: CRISPR-associated protein Cas4 [Pseudonocardia sp.]
MISAEDVGGVHVKYLYHCPRQLWLFSRGLRPERLSSLVQFGEAVHDTTYTRSTPVDLGAARIDFVDGQAWVHEVKSSSRSTEADRAQAIHYCRRLAEPGVAVRGAVLHYPSTRRTVTIPYEADEASRAAADIDTVLRTVAEQSAPPRLARSRCRGCSYLDYCWVE